MSCLRPHRPDPIVLRSLLGVVVLILILAGPAAAKVFDRCSLARSLYAHGMAYHELDDWVCLVEGESRFNTNAVNKINADGSYDWGLFQINDRYWCKPSDGRPSSNSCQLPCHLLLGDDIKHAAACALKIRHAQGFSAWVVWNSRCRGAKPSVHHCFSSHRFG